MPHLSQLYGGSLALLTDLYQLTMAYGFWRQGEAQRPVAFHLFCRKNPFDGGYHVAAGLQQVVEFCERFSFAEDDLAYLAELTGNDGKPLFDRRFIDHLGEMRFTCDVDAMPEGTVAFPHEPLLRVTGPILQAQILETPLLNLVNFQTLIASKAARICSIAKGPVLEFGLRRAQGIDGGLSASRAAYLGGCAATSNVLAGKLFGIPVKGTHAHSWVMFFEDELRAFEAYAEAMPNNCIFLVDTYDTLQGVEHAIQVGHQLRQKGHELLGVRLDSGDLAYLSQRARQMLDEAGFPKAAIVASNELDEFVMTSLQQQEAHIGLWGVGTKLATAFDQPALGGVYKLAAVQNDRGEWVPRVKLSEQAIKTSTPGRQQVRRFRDENGLAADVIYNVDSHPNDNAAWVVVDPMDPTRQKRLAPGMPHEDLLVPVFREGKRVYQPPTLAESRERAQDQIAALHPGVRRFMNPHQYPAGLELSLHQLRLQLIQRARNLPEPVIA